jgi:hypothetical protein
VQTISVDRIFLDLANPRHKPYKTESEVIEYLCREEYVFALAKDIVKIGLNPLELFALIPLDKEKGSRRTFMVAEGNRRMCAIKLLHDPDLAPAKLRKDYAKMAQDTTGGPAFRVLCEGWGFKASRAGILSDEPEADEPQANDSKPFPLPGGPL